MSKLTKAIVGVVSDVKTIDPHPFHMAGDKYLRALVQAAGVVPVILPSLLDVMDAKQWLAPLHGLFLPGAYSMMNPSQYGQDKIDRDDYDYDERRDNTSLGLIRAALTADLPILAVCRGCQELNVAMGGSLKQSIDSDIRHHEDKQASLDEQYGPSHSVSLVEGGLLHSICGQQRLDVNSLHSQAVDDLGKGLRVEAFADDGLVEAFSVQQAHFALALQWHPEWQCMQNPTQQKIFVAFG